MSHVKHGFLAALALAAALFGAAAQAQDFPVKGKPITIIVPYAPGGVADAGARLMAAALEKEFGTPVQVVNKPGAASQIGLTELARSKPDGYTLSTAALPTVTTHYLDPSREAPYGRKDFTLIANHHYTPNVLAVRSDSPWKTLNEFIDAAKQKPMSIRIGDPGLLSVPHFLVLMLERASGAKFTSIHFGGSAPAITALLGNHLDALAGGTVDALQHKNAGTFRVLGIAVDAADKSMPDVQPFRAQGFDVFAATHTGIVAPAGVPKDVVEKLTTTIKKVIESPEHQKKLEEMGATPAYRDPETYSKIWADTEKDVKPILESVAAEKSAAEKK
jgi:tripartite-type tricarboxylate transporter receptor subunit TctC